jgi:hypothetical protein
MDGVNSKEAGSEKSRAAASRYGCDGHKDDHYGEQVKKNIGDMISDGIETGKLIVYSIAYPPQGPVRSVIHAGEKIGWNLGKVFN